MRYMYSLLIYLFIPFIILYLKKRAKKNPKYALFWNERFGYNISKPSSIDKPYIWLHAVSVGETRAMAKLVELISDQYPNYQILITQMTPTGRDTASILYPNAVLHYIPYDFPHAVKIFYKIFKPTLGLIMETEIWPNLLHYAKEYSIPLYLINARLSQKSFTSYNRGRFLLTPVLNKLDGILCQDETTYVNFKKLGFNNFTEIVGNTKFDLVVDNKQLDLATHLSSYISNRKVVVFASTRDGEEEVLLNSIPDKFDYLIIIVPRHPERFALVEQLLINKGLLYQRRSDRQDILPQTQVFLADSLGEMLAYYKICDLAVIGGSFTECGGQNLVEAIYMNKPVIFGSSMYNFETISKNALNYGCAKQVVDMKECLEVIQEMFDYPDVYNDMATKCNMFINRYQGASLKTLSIIQKHL